MQPAQAAPAVSAVRARLAGLIHVIHARIRIPFATFFGLEQFGIKFGLQNIHAIVAALDHPERAFRSVHIAGTNGKGSVTAMVDSRRSSGAGIDPAATRRRISSGLNERFVIDGRAGRRSRPASTPSPAVRDVRIERARRDRSPRGASRRSSR